MIVCFINYEDKYIENVNKVISKIYNIFEPTKVYIYHDNIYNGGYDKRAQVIIKNKNMGALWARKYLIENIPSEYDNEQLIWIDSDDDIKEDAIKYIFDTYNSYEKDLVSVKYNNVLVWDKVMRVSLFKRAASFIPDYKYELNFSYKEDVLYSAIIDKIVGNNYIIDYNIDYIEYSGRHYPLLLCHQDILNSGDRIIEALTQYCIWLYDKKDIICEDNIQQLLLGEIRTNKDRYACMKVSRRLLNKIILQTLEKVDEKYHEFIKENLIFIM